MKNYYLPKEEKFGFITSFLYSFFVIVPSFRHFYAFVVEDLSSSGAESLLDVGTGPGDLPKRLADLHKFKAIYAVDPSAAMLGIARHKTKSTGVVLGRGSSRHLPFGRKFDIIFTAISFHHWQKKAKSLRYLKKFLAPKGEIRIYEFDKKKLGGMHRLFAPSHATDKDEVEKFAKDASLKIKNTKEVENFIRVSLMKNKFRA